MHRKRYWRYRAMDVHVASLGEFPHRPSMCSTIIVTETVREAGQHRLASIVQGHLPLQKEEDTKSSPFVQTERMDGRIPLSGRR